MYQEKPKPLLGEHRWAKAKGIPLEEDEGQVSIPLAETLIDNGLSEAFRNKLNNMKSIEDIFSEDSICETLERFETERSEAQDVMIFWTVDGEVHWSSNGIETDRLVFLLEVVKHKLLGGI